MTGEAIPNTAGLEFPIKVVPPKPKGSGRSWYHPNRRSFGAFMRSEQMRDVTEEVAKDIAGVANASVPEPYDDVTAAERKRVGVVYKVKREAGLVKVSGNLRVRVDVVGSGQGAERAEFGYESDGQRYRTLGQAGLGFGDMKHSEDVK